MIGCYVEGILVAWWLEILQYMAFLKTGELLPIQSQKYIPTDVTSRGAMSSVVESYEGVYLSAAGSFPKDVIYATPVLIMSTL